MTFEIAFVLVVTLVALILLALGRFSPDLVAFGVLLVLFFARVITVEQALSGFSNQAVIAVGAILVISAGLTSTGVAAHLGAWIRRAAGNSEVRLIALTMVSVAVLSAFMNSVGACAVLLPAVVAAAREMNTPVSRALMPLAFGSLLGAMLTLVGTPSNILASGVLEQSGYEPFGLFEFTPFGALALLLGIGLILLTRRRLLPVRSGGAQAAPPGVEHQAYRLDERLFEAVVPADSQLVGQSLLAAGIGEAFGIAVLAIEREGNIAAAPAPGEVLLAGDYLLLGAREADIDRLRQVHGLQVQDRMRLGADALRAGSLSMTELVLRPRSDWSGRPWRPSTSATGLDPRSSGSGATERRAGPAWPSWPWRVATLSWFTDPPWPCGNCATRPSSLSLPRMPRLRRGPAARRWRWRFFCSSSLA